jgi:hypothetical protein
MYPFSLRNAVALPEIRGPGLCLVSGVGVTGLVVAFVSVSAKQNFSLAAGKAKMRDLSSNGCDWSKTYRLCCVTDFCCVARQP